METIIEVKPMDNILLWILFADNFSATINIRPYISKGISAKLLDTEYFKQVRIDDFGGITWSNGFDFCPNFLREITDLNNQ